MALFYIIASYWLGRRLSYCSGGIILAWKEVIFDRAETWLGRHVVAARLVNRMDGSAVVTTSAYVPSATTLRGELWEDLVQLCRAFPDTPILIGGDFNVTLAVADRPNGAGGRDPRSAEFREVLAQLGLVELGPSDRRFTWRGPTSQSRLDRFLCSIELLDRFPLVEVISLPRPLSHHTPISWSTQAGPSRPTYFKMDRSWLRDEGFKRDIFAWWHSHPNFGSASDRLITKLKDFCHHLFNLRRQIQTTRIRNRDTALARVQTLDALEEQRPLTIEESMERKTSRVEVAEADLRIEMDWRQRSREHWLSAGDANTRFFHQMANGRRRLNGIRRLRIGDRVLNDQAAVGQAFAEHFRDFYRRGPTNQWRWLATGASVLDPSQQQKLILPFSEDEVKDALQGLNNEGAPGLDGIPVFFYKDCWDTVRHEVMAALEDFRTGRCQMDRLNKAYIVLLPKFQGAEQISDFRPISLSNSLYLIFAKVLANRLRGVLPLLISPFQSAFIPGRQMADNIVLAEEIVAAWHRDGTTGFMWKVDFAKAYDSIDWRFLWNVLRRRGFPETWVRWVKQCVTTSTFAVLVNGRPQGGWIHPQRGTDRDARWPPYCSS